MQIWPNTAAAAPAKLFAIFRNLADFSPIKVRDMVDDLDIIEED